MLQVDIKETQIDEKGYTDTDRRKRVYLYRKTEKGILIQRHARTHNEIHTRMHDNEIPAIACVVAHGRNAA